MSRRFAGCMSRGDMKAAIALLDSDDRSGAPMGLDMPLVSEDPSWTVCDELLRKHPKGQPACSAALKSLDGCGESFHPVVFEVLDGALIRNAALRTRGAAGPSGLDAFGWRRLCTSFQQASDDLCCSLALVACKLCTSCVDLDGIIALVACHLIALNKCPGVRPIGVGEMVRRIIAKAILSIVKLDVLEAAGSLQLCAGQDAGNEAAVHAMRAIFCDDSTEAVLLVDASNAFNSLNRQVALHNIQALCPPLTNILINTYRQDIPLFIDGRHIFSSEGTTQGNLLSMAMYSVSVTPLIASLQDSRVKQVWFTDDATAGGTLHGLHDWWSRLQDLGSLYGYSPNASKTWLIVEHAYFSDAQWLFEGTGVQVTVEGKRHLGVALGSRSFTEQYVSEKVDSWSRCVAKLSDLAKVHPHYAYSAFTHGLCNKWTYFLRTIPGISSLLKPLEAVISSKFIPTLTGRFVSNDERALLALPIRMGGLGIIDPQTVSDSEFAASEKVTFPLVGLILQQEMSFGCHIVDAQRLAKSEVNCCFQAPGSGGEGCICM